MILRIQSLKKYNFNIFTGIEVVLVLVLRKHIGSLDISKMTKSKVPPDIYRRTPGTVSSSQEPEMIAVEYFECSKQCFSKG